MKSKFSEYILPILVISFAVIYYHYLWGDLSHFIIAIDHCDILFCDFVKHYYPTGEAIFTSGIPDANYYYTSFFAIFLGIISKFQLTIAVKIWMCFQILFTFLLYLIPVKWIFQNSVRFRILYLFSILTSYPVLHNFKWGQISVLITVAVLTALYLFENGNKKCSSFLLAFVISIKYYAVIFVLYFVFRKQWKFVVHTVLIVFLMVFVFPTLVLGTHSYTHFFYLVQRQIIEANQTFLIGNIDSQFFPSVVHRFAKFSYNSESNRTFLEFLGYVFATLQIGYVGHLVLNNRFKNPMYVFGVFFLITPFFVATSWPHYFVYLPLCQCFILMSREKLLYSNASKFLAGTSFFLSSILCFTIFKRWEFYNAFGLTFFSNMLMLVAMWLEIIGQIKKSDLTFTSA